MRDGVQTARRAGAEATAGTVVFCESASAHDPAQVYQQLFQVDADGAVVTRDLQRVLAALKCGPDEPAVAIPPGLNGRVVDVRRAFAEEVAHRESAYEHEVSLGQGQRYVLRELAVLFKAVPEADERRGQINLLEQAFRRPSTDAVRRELARVRRDRLAGDELLAAMKAIYVRHGLGRVTGSASADPSVTVPRVVTSEGLVA